MTVFLRGKVYKGKQRGKLLGFPTANISIHQNISQGVYISVTKMNNKTFQSLTFIGAARTFQEHCIQAETHIFDFHTQIYGTWISIQLLKKIRSNKKFHSASQLIKEIQKDKQQAQLYFYAHAVHNDV
ncbi:MAG TPA: riboflavin kinase [Patescibacteria group bacterium]|nr:riboflavin kinase [Patescibacteria group bacterium]